jgi:hypothetical protein
MTGWEAAAYPVSVPQQSREEIKADGAVAVGLQQLVRQQVGKVVKNV